MNDRFTEENLAKALMKTCAVLGLDPTGARLIKYTNNAVYALAAAPVVIRIVASDALRYRVPTVVLVAQYLQTHQVPAVRLLAGVEQPLSVDGYLVTAWDYVRPQKMLASARDLAGPLHQMHALPPPEGLGAWAPLKDVRARIATAQELSTEDHAFLTERCAEVEVALNELEYALPTALVHGDAHPRNVIVGAAGPVLCDFDSACVGPPEWDLTPIAVGVERFGDSAQIYQDLVDAYGFDLIKWKGYPVLRAVRELKLTTSVLPTLRSNPKVRPELTRRLDDLRAGGTKTTKTLWTRYR